MVVILTSHVSLMVVSGGLSYVLLMVVVPDVCGLWLCLMGVAHTFTDDGRSHYFLLIVVAVGCDWWWLVAMNGGGCSHFSLALLVLVPDGGRW